MAHDFADPPAQPAHSPPATVSPAQPSAASLGSRRLAAVVALLFACFAWYCHHWPHLRTANEALRLQFVQAVIETGRPELDAVTKRAGHVPVDRSEFGGHIYMDKAPGASLAALPLYAAWLPMDDQVRAGGLWRFGYGATLLTMALPVCAALWFMARMLRRQRIGARAGLIAIAALGTASPLLVYATLFFGHALAAACIGAAFALIAGQGDEPALRRRDAWLAGLLLGFAGLTDTPVFLLAAMVAAYAVLRVLPVLQVPQTVASWRAADRLRAAWPVLAGLGIGALLQLGYNLWVLGHPLRFTYQFKADRNLAAIMATGFLGFQLPQAEALVGLLLSAKRGLLYHAPWLALAAGGLGWTATRKELPAGLRTDAAASLLISLLYILLVSGFADWRAGDSAGARHLLPVVPLLGWGLAPLLAPPAPMAAPLPVWLRGVAGAAVVAGVLLHVPTVATFPYHFDKLNRPVLEMAVPLLFNGGFSPSVGQWVGADPYASFALFLALIAAVWALVWWPRGDSPSSALVVGAALVVLTVWATGMAASVPEVPGRTAQVARYNAWAMLQSGTTGKPAGVHITVPRPPELLPPAPPAPAP